MAYHMENDEDECAGFALFFTNYSTFLAKPGLYLEDVFVKPHLRRKGIGLALLKKLAAIARERDYGRMEWSVLDWNEPAIQFLQEARGGAAGGVDYVPADGRGPRQICSGMKKGPALSGVYRPAAEGGLAPLTAGLLH